MNDLSVQTEALRALATTHEGVAAEISSAGNFDTAAHVAALTPVFGLIGADYLAMFAGAQVRYARNISDLSHRVGAIASAANTSAATYDGTDESFASRIDTLGGEEGAS